MHIDVVGSVGMFECWNAGIFEGWLVGRWVGGWVVGWAVVDFVCLLLLLFW